MELVDRVMLEMDKKKTPINIFLDLSKAFDTLNYEILLQKLKYYGITEIALNLMESYITNRKQFVIIDDIMISGHLNIMVLKYGILWLYL